MCPSDQRVPPCLFQGNVHLLHSSILTKLPGNKKTQKANNGNDQATKTRDFLIFSLKVSLKHLCVALSSVNIESTGCLPMLLPHSFLCHFLPHTQKSSRDGEKRQPCSVSFMLIAKVKINHEHKFEEGNMLAHCMSRGRGQRAFFQNSSTFAIFFFETSRPTICTSPQPARERAPSLYATSARKSH